MMLVKQLAVEYVGKRMNPAAGRIFQVEGPGIEPGSLNMSC